jgi:hypothetical protein
VQRVDWVLSPWVGSGMNTASSVNIDLPTDAAMNQALEQLKHLDETLPPSDAAAVPSPMITPPAGSSAPTEDSAPNDNSGSTAVQRSIIIRCQRME